MPKHDPTPVSPETHQRHRLGTWWSLASYQQKKDKTDEEPKQA